MYLDEHILIQKPPTVQNKNLRFQGRWIHKAVLKAVWELRRRVMDEEGVDIFNVRERDGYIELAIRGELDAMDVKPSWLRREDRKKFRKPNYRRLKKVNTSQ